MPDDLPGQAAAEARITTPGRRVAANGFLSVQVNIDAEGNNIVGDAANEPSIAVDPTNRTRMAIGWRQFDTIQSNFRQAGNGSSGDGGRSWRAQTVLDPGNFRSDPVLESDRDGVFYYYSLRSNFLCDMYRSFDGGRTYTAPTFAFGGDKAWFTLDNTESQGDGHIYVSWSTAGNPHSPNQFTRSTDGGTDWNDPVEFPNPKPRWGTLAVNAAGDLFMSGTSGGGGGFRLVRSTNAKNSAQSVSFDRNVGVDLGGDIALGGAPNPGGLMGQVWMGADTSGGPTDGNLYMLCSVDPPGADPMDVNFIRSEDGGETWSAPTRVNAVQDGWQWFGTMSVAPSGRIHAVWNDTSNSGESNISELFYAFSDDAGVTWSEGAAVSPSFDSTIGWPQQNKLGDYYDMKSDLVGADLAYAATFNGEQDVYYLRFGDYDCNGNGRGDAEDIAEGISEDANGNEIPDECECLADVDGDGVVDFDDLLRVLSAWGPCEACPEDVDGDGEVDFDDLLRVLSAWGPCR